EQGHFLEGVQQLFVAQFRHDGVPFRSAPEHGRYGSCKAATPRSENGPREPWSLALLLLQSVGQPSHLRGRSSERRRSLVQLGLHRPGQLGEGDLAGVQVGNPLDLGHRKGTALHVAALDDQGFVVLSEITRSEEHTSELQSREKLVCRLLLEKK